MAPITKDNEVLTVAPDASGSLPVATTPGARHEDTASKPQPVALEVPVTVNGARTVEGSDKREPFSETTKTVLVFGNGAVIRLGSPVAAGQLLFLTNEKTKKEVVCQVVKSKNYRNVSGYVELEFTESVVGFWGMRFPSDRIGAHTPAPPANTAVPTKNIPAAPISVAPKVASSTVTAAPKISEVYPAPAPAVVTPIVPARLAESKTLVPFPANPSVPSTPAPASSAPTATRIPEMPAIPVPPMSAGLTSSVVSLLSASEAQPEPAPVKPPAVAIPFQSKPAPVSGAPENPSEELKLQAARLQEQLSSLLFNSAPDAKPASSAPASDSKTVSGVTAKVFELAKTDSVSAKVARHAKALPSPIKSSLDTEEVKIPSWLEPLARNAAAPAPTPERTDREKFKHAAESAAREESATQLVPPAEAETASEIEMPAFGSLLPLEAEVANHDRPSGGSRRGILLATIAAGLLLAAGGGWYLYHPANGQQGTSAPLRPVASVASSSTTSSPSTSQPVSNDSAAAHDPSSRSNEAQHSSAPESRETFMKSPSGAQSAPLSRDNTRDSAATIPAAITERISKPAPQPEIKKPVLGEVHLASPTVNRTDAAHDGGVVAPTISTSDENANSGGLASGLAAGNGKQPVAPEVPLPIGGDVKPASLLSEVAPVYPIMAKNQHVTGDVVIDALIDANGRVTTMKVISGPALLHQSAKDALRQWKYQPASLDGKPVPMHLTVKLQFRMP